MTGKNLLLTFLGLVLIVPVARYVGRSAAEAENSREAAAAASGDLDVKTMVSRQDSDGVTEADLTPEFLKNLEAWTLERTRANATKHWDAAGVPEDMRNMSAEATYVSAGAHKLAVIRTRINGVTPTAVIFGIVGTEAVRVLCMVQVEGNVPVSSGVCDEKVRETFGASMNPMNNANG